MPKRSDKIETPGLAAQAFERLQHQIVDGMLEPGSRLIIDQLADEFGVSPIPVREALARLREKHLVEHDPNKGYRVASRLSIDDLKNLFEARCLLETCVAERVVANADRAMLDQVRSINERIAGCEPGTTFANFRKVLELNDEFHSIIVESAGNRFIHEAHSALNYGARISRELFGLGVPDLNEIVAEHARIIHAIETEDAEALSIAITAHIEDGFERFSKELSVAV